ncbi:MAG: A/G-specific adenine glycosylase [Rhodoglobus sp.]
MSSSAVIEWFVTHGRNLPWRREGFGAWGILVSEVMLQQTPVARVIPRLREWLERWPSPADLAAAAPGDAVRAWDRLGYPRRALRLHAAAVTITERHHGVVPSDIAQLLALPGVGDYTARAVASFAYGLRHPVVDTNVRRVIARAELGHGEASTPSTRRDLQTMEALLPTGDEDARLFNAAMMELGAIICTARSPRCLKEPALCPLSTSCRWRAEGYPPYQGPSAATQPRFEGSDRQVRGLIMAALRNSSIPVTMLAIESLWPDVMQRERALAGLLSDGLAVAAPGGYMLPS